MHKSSSFFVPCEKDTFKQKVIKGIVRGVKKNSPWLLFLLPALVFYSVFMAIPLLQSLRLSFYTGTGLTPDRFVGFANYGELLNNALWRTKFFNALLNTMIFFGINMAVQNTLGLMFAVFLDENIKGSAVYRTIIFLPATISILVTGFLWKLILNPQWGAVNILMTKLGLEQFALPWLGDTRTALVTITLVSCWQWVGLPTMMFLAGLQSIPQDLYDAAYMDGASNWYVFRRIKVPLLFPVIGIVSILTFVANFNAFDIIFAMAGSKGSPSYSTDLMGTFFYRTAIAGEHPVARPDMGIGAAIATITLIYIIYWSFPISKIFSSKE